MDEMDGEPEESAEIAMGIMDNLLREHTAWEECDTRTHACYEVMS
jgi:hypothetical protein